MNSIYSLSNYGKCLQVHSMTKHSNMYCFKNTGTLNILPINRANLCIFGLFRFTINVFVAFDVTYRETWGIEGNNFVISDNKTDSNSLKIYLILHIQFTNILDKNWHLLENFIK